MVTNRSGPFKLLHACLVRFDVYFDSYPIGVWSIASGGVSQQRDLAGREFRLQEVVQRLFDAASVTFNLAVRGRRRAVINHHQVYSLVLQEPGIRFSRHFIRAANVNLLGTRVIREWRNKKQEQANVFHALKITF
jgi:hypothetical protein